MGSNLPPEVLQSVKLIRIERQLLGEVAAAVSDYLQILGALEAGIVEGTADTKRLADLSGAMFSSRGTLAGLISDIAMFSTDPQAWIPNAVMRGYQF